MSSPEAEKLGGASRVVQGVDLGSSDMVCTAQSAVLE